MRPSPQSPPPIASMARAVATAALLLSRKQLLNDEHASSTEAMLASHTDPQLLAPFLSHEGLLTITTARTAGVSLASSRMCTVPITFVENVSTGSRFAKWGFERNAQ